MIGAMAMPLNFEYADVFRKGQPCHQRFDPFRLKHPSMENSRRAKIFAPFDALAGFSDEVASKEVMYTFRRELSEEEKEELNRRLGILHRLTRNGRIARENRVSVSITYYVPCGDRDNFSYGCRGQYVTVAGICRKIGMRTMQVDDLSIPLADIASIACGREMDGRNIFDREEESW